MHLLNRFNAILFDFDGTLAPNLDLPRMKRDVVNLTIEQTGIPAADIEQLMIVEVIGHTARLLERRGEDSTAYARAAHCLIRDIELEAARQTELFPGVRELFQAIRDKGICSGIVSRNCAQAIRIVFPDVDEHCDCVVARDDVEHLKPDPRHILHCLDQVQANAATSAMVGDGASDMRVGRTLRMFCIGVLGGSSERVRLLDAGADVVVERVTDIFNQRG